MTDSEKVAISPAYIATTEPGSVSFAEFAVESSPAVAAFTMPVTEIDAESPTWAFTQVFLTCSVPCLRLFV